MKTKKIKTKLVMGLSVLIVSFLISTSFLSIISTKALLEEEYYQHRTDSFDRSAWKWSPTEVVSTESTGDSYDPSLAVDAAGNVHIAWDDGTDYAGSGTDSDIFYKRWDYSAASWTTTEAVSTESTDDSYNPSLAVDAAGNVHIAWDDYTDYANNGTDVDIFYKRWDYSTALWTTTEVVSTESTLLSFKPSLAVDAAGNVHIAWEDYTDYANNGTDVDIFYKRWEASTSTWTTTEVVSTESTGDSYDSSLAIDAAGNVHIAWDDATGSDWDIFYKHWEASTSSWTTTEVVSTESAKTSRYPSLDSDAAGNVHIAWVDSTVYAGSKVDLDIFYKRWNASGSTWTITEVVSTESTGDSYDPSLAVDNAGDVHIAWDDPTDYLESGIDWDIFYKRWNVSSSSWTTTEVVSTESTGDSYDPSLDVDIAGNVHIAWADLTDYAEAGIDEDIFYKVLAGPPAAPVLASIVPNPTELPTINLDWNDGFRATTYYVYRSNSSIGSVVGLSPLITVFSSDYIDTLPSEDFYYYVVVAENFVGNSTLSNCEDVEYKIPIIPEFTMITGILLFTVLATYILVKFRRRKMNNH